MPSLSISPVEPTRCSSQGLLERSALYRNFHEQREEILRHKWIMSERVGHDVGFEAALLDWITNHRASWIAERRRGKRG